MLCLRWGRSSYDCGVQSLEGRIPVPDIQNDRSAEQDVDTPTPQEEKPDVVDKKDDDAEDAETH